MNKPLSIDRNKHDPYVGRLVSLNNTNAVLAAEDIYNEFGVLLITKGTPISPTASKRLQQHKLDKPLDVQVKLERSISRNDILCDTLSFLEKQPELQHIHRSYDFDAALRHYIFSRDIEPLLRQKLTVMAAECPALYSHSLFVAWVSVVIATEMNLNRETCYKAYIAGLFHDVGNLHLPKPDEQEGASSEEQWRALQSHVVIGQVIVKELGGDYEDIGQAIVEHHERMDMTGYPYRRPANKLSLCGQVVGAAELIVTFCQNELKNSSQPLIDCIAYLKIHRGAFRPEVHAASLRLLLRAPRTEASETEPRESLLSRLKERNQQLDELRPVLLSIQQQDEHLLKDRDGLAVLSVTRSILDTMAHSGLGSAMITEWLSGDDIAEESFANLQELDHMQYELLWLFKRMTRSLETFLRTSPEAFTPDSPLNELHQQLEQASKPVNTPTTA